MKARRAPPHHASADNASARAASPKHTPERSPERVHVVRPPQDDKNIEVIRVLAQITDKLKRSEAERQELLAEIREYRKTLNDLEDRNAQAEKKFVSLEGKIQQNQSEQGEDLEDRQARIEKALKEADDKLVKAIAGQALIDQRIQETENQQTAIFQRLDESVATQARMDRQIEKVSQDRARMLRKVERLEEVVVETKDVLQAKAMVLLTDQSAVVRQALPGPDEQDLSLGDNAPFWQKSVQMQAVGMAAMIVAALLGGWMINHIQQPKIPEIAILERGGLARLNLDEQRWEPIVSNGQPVESETFTKLLDKPESDTAASETFEEQQLDFKDDTNLLAALEQDAESVAEQLNAIAPAETQNIDAAKKTRELDKRVQEFPEVDITKPAIIKKEKAVKQSQKQEQTAKPVEDTISQEIVAKTQDTKPADNAANKTKEQETEDIKVSSLNTRSANPVSLNSNTATTQDIVKEGAFGSEDGRFPQEAFAQDPKTERAIFKGRVVGDLAKAMRPDPDLPQMIKAYETQAYEGVVEAQHDLAAIYTAGHGGVAQNFKKAAFWFRVASDNGSANARYNLGVLYHQGLGVDRDLEKALYWYREAAKLSHPEALYNLGIAHIEGIGSDYNPHLAAAFFEKAANNGIMEAAYNLGLIYENALLGAAQSEEALLWYKIAADSGSPDAGAAADKLADKLGFGPDEVDELVERLQSIHVAVKGKPAGPRQDVSNKAASSMQALTAKIQDTLMGLGLYPGPADGIAGPKTQDAIRSYQSKFGLEIDGKPSQNLLGHMVESFGLPREQGSREN